MNLRIAKDASEIISYENPNLPLYIARGRMSNFSNMKALGHWHDDIEVMLATNGNFSYDVNGRKFFVREGDAIIVNAQQMHYGYSADGSDGEYLCVLFQPHLLTGSQFILEKYINPIIQNPHITETFLRRENESHRAVLNALDKFSDITRVVGNELEFLSVALDFWLKWFNLLQAAPLVSYEKVDSGIEIQKRIFAVSIRRATSLKCSPARRAVRPAIIERSSETELLFVTGVAESAD
ncbi:MAG: AraC family ligand binding domain-containing protein [Selenomonadaceae bacterium]|nr:AraC family ligand binding domain-containing protein [Selenomonadaceae bacterium]